MSFVKVNGLLAIIASIMSDEGRLSGAPILGLRCAALSNKLVRVHATR